MMKHTPLPGHYDALPRSYRRTFSSTSLVEDARKTVARLKKVDPSFTQDFKVNETGRLESICGNYQFNPAFFGLANVEPGQIIHIDFRV